MNNIIQMPDPAPGIYETLSNEAYHGGPGISNTGLKLIARSPAHYYGRTLDPNRPEEKDKGGQLEGNLAHCAALEPDEFDKRYAVGPTVHRGTKVWKDFLASLPPGVEGIHKPQRDVAFAQAASIHAISDEVRDALADGMAEPSAYWIDEATGVLCKCRPDFVHSMSAGDLLLDVKTCSDASPDEFRLQCARKMYHMQDAWYSHGWAQASGRRLLGFIFIAVETEYPYAASAVVLDDDSRDQGDILWRRYLDRYADCLDAGRWPGFEAMEVVRLPGYALRDVA